MTHQKYAKTDPLTRWVYVVFAAACGWMVFRAMHLETRAADTVAFWGLVAMVILLLAPPRRPTINGFIDLVEAVGRARHGGN